MVLRVVRRCKRKKRRAIDKHRRRGGDTGQICFVMCFFFSFLSLRIVRVK